MILRVITSLKRRVLAPRNFQQALDVGLKRIVIGASGQCPAGWAQSEASFLNLLQPEGWPKYFAQETLEAILAEHVWEHLDEGDGLVAAKTCFAYLKPGGYLRVAVPDGFNPDKNYLDSVRPGGTGVGARDHKVLYNYKSFSSLFEKVGFKTQLYEYFNEEGEFQFREWNPADGMIRRSLRYDPRNKDGIISYSSIVLDACKPAIN